MSFPVIFLCLDQMTNINFLPDDIKSTLNGFNKFHKRCIYFNKHIIGSTPCSPSRGIIYTGLNTPKTKVTDNSNNDWQSSLPDVESGLKTMGSYFKEHKYETRYIGKVHFDAELNRNNVQNYKPTMATQNRMKKYDFDIFNKQSDFAYHIDGAFFGDNEVMSQQLPNGNDPDKCDLYDKKTNSIKLTL